MALLFGRGSAPSGKWERHGGDGTYLVMMTTHL